MLFFIEEKTEKRVEEIGKLIYRNRIAFDLKIREAGYEEYRDFPRNNEWGGKDVTVWFKNDAVTIPTEWMDKKLALYLNLTDYKVQGVNPEALVFINGYAVQGCDKNHREIIIPKHLVKEGKFRLDIKAFSGFRHYTNRYLSVELVTIEDRAEKLYFALRTAMQTALTFQRDEYMRASIFAVIDKALNAIDWRKYGEESHYASMKKALKLLKAGLKEVGGNPARPRVICVGHSHIDVAWYWMLKHTREKASRTFSTALNLMEQYPEYYFIQSQAQLYKFIKNDYPDIYKRIKEKVKEGRWEANGGMWVEADCNISSGESLVRQLLFGTRFFRNEFGVENKTLWLPDAFGFNANLPQIINKSGFKYFVTTKIGWNQFNRPPYDNFLWKGLDGSTVLVNFMTMPEHPNDESSWAYSYNSEPAPNILRRMWKNYRHVDINNEELLMSFGYGDGGGGTTRDMIESLEATEFMPAGPVCKMGKVEDYLVRLEKRIKDNPHLPTWDGELYLEMHRGTLTSQAKNKWYNRKLELALHDVEALYGLVNLDNYPQEEINNAWEIVLLNQFHDILPGSSIREVYEESLEQYANTMKSVLKLKSQGLDGLASSVRIDQDSVIVFNSLSWNRSSYAYVEKTKDMRFLDGDREVSTQIVTIGNKEFYMLYVEDVPSYGYRVLKMIPGEPGERKKNVIVTRNSMENRFFKVMFNEKGYIISIFDKVNNREVLDKGKAGNVLTAYEDKPVNFDAWDIDIFYRDKGYVIDSLGDVEIIEEGTERGTLKLQWKYMNSDIVQYIHMYNNIPRIDFETEIDWKEKQTLIKVAFPVDIRTTMAAYDIQFGNIQRPTHNNTAWDYAKFEVAGHKWADLSQRDYGVSILNDSKYGHSIKENVIELTLLKSAIEPDPLADKCHHSFVYSIYPHTGDWFNGNTVKQAYDLNLPLIVTTANANNGTLPEVQSFIECTADTVIVETVKKSEDSKALIIRAYEYANSASAGELKFRRRIKAAFECDMLERNAKPIDFDGNSIRINFKPFELKCYMVEFE